MRKIHWTVYFAVFIIAAAFFLWHFDEQWKILYTFFGNNTKSLAEIMTYAGVAAGGMLFIGNLLINDKRVKIMEEQNKKQEEARLEQKKQFEKQIEKTAEQIQVMYKGNVDTRFNNAVGHLGNANPSVVLCGIHALHQVAVDNKNYTQIVHNLFCSYLRENSAKLYENIDFEETPEKCPVIIQTLIDYLFKSYNNRESVYKEYESDLSFSTLKNCDFFGTKINNVNFSYCELERCDFSSGNLTNCIFFEGILNECNFSFGNLTECDFSCGDLTECNFHRINLTKCDFCPTTLSKCDFSFGNLTECNFDGGILTKCDFWKGNLISCDFGDGNLINCWFKGGTLTKCVFRDGTLNECSFIDNEFDGKWDAKLLNCTINETTELINTELTQVVTS